MRGGRCFIVVKVQKEYVKSFVDKKQLKKKKMFILLTGKSTFVSSRIFFFFLVKNENYIPH